MKYKKGQKFIPKQNIPFWGCSDIKEAKLISIDKEVNNGRKYCMREYCKDGEIWIKVYSKVYLDKYYKIAPRYEIGNKFYKKIIGIIL